MQAWKPAPKRFAFGMVGGYSFGMSILKRNLEAMRRWMPRVADLIARAEVPGKVSAGGIGGWDFDLLCGGSGAGGVAGRDVDAAVVGGGAGGFLGGGDRKWVGAFDGDGV